MTLAATLAWLIATRIMQHHIPFFAPIAAVVALNTTLGQRGSNAIRLLVGVGMGIVVSEFALWLLGGGFLQSQHQPRIRRCRISFWSHFTDIAGALHRR